MSYQAIYDAAFRQFDISFQRDIVVQEIVFTMGEIRKEHTRPSVLMRPSLTVDGNQWCALYGDNLQEGVAGFGDTPEEAFKAFDAAWNSEKLPQNASAAKSPADFLTIRKKPHP